jgi:hypothetical protein
MLIVLGKSKWVRMISIPRNSSGGSPGFAHSEGDESFNALQGVGGVLITQRRRHAPCRLPSLLGQTSNPLMRKCLKTNI